MRAIDELIAVLLVKADTLESMAATYDDDNPRRAELLNKAKGVRLAVSYAFELFTEVI